jgi:FAD/FMN-containing dehydrogenase
MPVTRASIRKHILAEFDPPERDSLLARVDAADDKKELKALLAELPELDSSPNVMAKRPKLDQRLGAANWTTLARWATSLGVAAPDGRDGFDEDGLFENDGSVVQRQPRLTERQLRVAIRGEINRRDLRDWEPPGDDEWWTYVGRVDGRTATGVTIARPTSVAQLRALIDGAPTSTRVRAIGSGHSASHVAIPYGTAVDVTDLVDLRVAGDPAGAAPLGDLRAGFGLGADEHPERIPAGTPIWKLNRELWKKGFALRNLGAYDEQSIAGAMLTGTHGSGGHLGPLAEDILSIDLVTTSNQTDAQGLLVSQVVRIERANGPTDPTAFAAIHPGYDDLIQDDAVFRAAGISLGAFGVAFALTVIVRKKFFLKETRNVLPWADVKGGLAKEIRTAAASGIFVQMLFNPYGSDDKDRNILHIERVPADGTLLQVRKPPQLIEQGRRHGPTYATRLAELFTRRDLLATALRTVEGGDELDVGEPVARSIKAALDRKNTTEGRSWDIFYMGTGGWQAAVTTELALPLDRAVAALDLIGKRICAEPMGSTRRLWSPLGVRFMKGSELTLAAPAATGWWSADGTRATTDIVCMIEMPTPLIANLKRRKGALDLIRDLRAELIDTFGARPHWGKRNELTAGAVEKLWGKHALEAWLVTYRRFNHFHVFDGPMLTESGIAQRA